MIFTCMIFATRQCGSKYKFLFYLETSALIGEFSDSVEDEIDDFLTDGVVTTGVVVSGILFTGDQLFGVEKLTVGTGSDLE